MQCCNCQDEKDSDSCFNNEKSWIICNECKTGTNTECNGKYSYFFECDDCKKIFCDCCSFCNRYEYEQYPDYCSKCFKPRKKELEREFLEELDRQWQLEHGYKNDKDYIRAKNQREFALKHALKRNGLEFRDDSRLCENYIDDGDFDLGFVVRRMGEMKFLFEYCDIHDAIDKANINQAETLDAGYYPDSSVFDEAEDNVLQTIKGYPKYFPWQQDKAIRIIQKACYNWLWKPKTNDGKIGINLRLGLRDLAL